MKLKLLPAAVEDMKWFRSYYTSVFPAGAVKAREHIKNTKRIIQDHPDIGHETSKEGVREFPVTRTPFTYIYRVNGDYIEVLRVWDNRGNPKNKPF